MGEEGRAAAETNNNSHCRPAQPDQPSPASLANTYTGLANSPEHNSPEACEAVTLTGSTLLFPCDRLA